MPALPPGPVLGCSILLRSAQYSSCVSCYAASSTKLGYCATRSYGAAGDGSRTPRSRAPTVLRVRYCAGTQLQHVRTFVDQYCAFRY
eukprot:1740773-Rhodomonas_salina.2